MLRGQIGRHAALLNRWREWSVFPKLNPLNECSAYRIDLFRCKHGKQNIYLSKTLWRRYFYMISELFFNMWTRALNTNKYQFPAWFHKLFYHYTVAIIIRLVWINMLWYKKPCFYIIATMCCRSTDGQGEHQIFKLFEKRRINVIINILNIIKNISC